MRRLGGVHARFLTPETWRGCVHGARSAARLVLARLTRCCCQACAGEPAAEQSQVEGQELPTVMGGSWV